ncbi:MAG: hypothetical protein KKG99_10895 [Bacteroidetes bacterium]|nr:hypothetical protein [Bacteroidota bacterium]
MKIDRNNYEQYFIDHFDGRLDASLLKELKEFLLKNPDLNEEFESFEMININVGDQYNYADKASLKKPIIHSTNQINSENYDDYFIAGNEGDLTSAEMAEVASFIHLNPSLETEFKIYGYARVSPDQSIVFANKSGLKKYPFLSIKTWYKPIGIAASIILLIGIFNILRPTQVKTPSFERAEVPSLMKSNGIQSIQQDYQYPSITKREYQIAVTHFEEVIPTEILLKIPVSGIPIATYFASLGNPIKPAEKLSFKYEYDYLVKELMIKEELLLASFGETNPSSAKKVKKSLWANTFGKLHRKNSRSEDVGDETKKSKINLWTIASIGIESFNEMTGSNVNIERKLNKEGEKNKYILVNANANITTTDNQNH